MQIYLLSGAIRSGKTTWLKNQFIPQHSCFGILSPDGADGRYFYSIATKAFRKMEAEEGEKDRYSIGKYIFSKAAFDWAIAEIQHGLVAAKDYLILDEIGPLELKDAGFADLLRQLIANPGSVKNLLLVVREQAVDAVCEKFSISKGELIFIDKMRSNL